MPRLTRLLPLLRMAILLGGIQLLQLTRGDIVHERMQAQAAIAHGVDDGAVLAQGAHALQDVELDHLLGRLGLGQALEGLQVGAAQRAQRHQPGVEQAQLLVAEGGVDAAAAGVAAHDDVLHLQVPDRVLDHRPRAQVARVQDVGDVAVHEHVARLEA